MKRELIQVIENSPSRVTMLWHGNGLMRLPKELLIRLQELQRWSSQEA
jgi:hypothetical protein